MNSGADSWASVVVERHDADLFDAERFETLESLLERAEES